MEGIPYSLLVVVRRLRSPALLAGLAVGGLYGRRDSIALRIGCKAGENIDWQSAVGELVELFSFGYAADESIWIVGVLRTGKQAKTARQLLLDAGGKELRLLAGTLRERCDIHHYPTGLGGRKERRQILVVDDKKRSLALNLWIGKRELTIRNLNGELRGFVEDVSVILEPLDGGALLGVHIDELALERTGDDETSACVLVKAVLDVRLARGLLLFGLRLLLEIERWRLVGYGGEHGRGENDANQLLHFFLPFKLGSGEWGVAIWWRLPVRAST